MMLYDVLFNRLDKNMVSYVAKPIHRGLWCPLRLQHGWWDALDEQHLDETTSGFCWAPPLGTYFHHFFIPFCLFMNSNSTFEQIRGKNEESPIASKVCHAATQPRGPSHRVKIPGFRTSFQERGISRSGQARHSPRIWHR